MGLEQQVSHDAFDVWAVDAVLNSTAVTVIIDRNVEVADEDGNVRYVAALVHAKVGGLPAWDSGDLLEEDSGNVRLRQVVADDGYIQKIEASPVG